MMSALVAASEHHAAALMRSEKEAVFREPIGESTSFQSISLIVNAPLPRRIRLRLPVVYAGPGRIVGGLLSGPSGGIFPCPAFNTGSIISKKLSLTSEDDTVCRAEGPGKQTTYDATWTGILQRANRNLIRRRQRCIYDHETGLKASAFTDGLAKTAFFSERIKGSGNDVPTPPTNADIIGADLAPEAALHNSLRSASGI